jgi:hypothetical protein
VVAEGRHARIPGGCAPGGRPALPGGLSYMATLTYEARVKVHVLNIFSVAGFRELRDRRKICSNPISSRAPADYNPRELFIARQPPMRPDGALPGEEPARLTSLTFRGT